MESDQVLVGVDGSENSERAFEVALSIAAKRQWSLRLIWVYEVPYGGQTYGGAVSYERYRNAITQEAEGVLAKLGAKAQEAGVEASSRVMEDFVVRRLVHESRSARLTVVGKRGRNRFAGRFLGSVSSGLSSHAYCPTLVVPERWEAADTGKLVAPAQERPGGESAEDEPIELMAEAESASQPQRSFENISDQMNFDQEVVVGIDVDDSVSTSLALQAAEYAVVFGRPLTLVTANPLKGLYLDPDVAYEHSAFRRLATSHLSQLTQEISEKNPGLSVHWQLFDGSPGGLLSEASRTAALLVVGSRGRGGFAGLLLGSVSQTVLSRAVAPTLVVNPQR